MGIPIVSANMPTVTNEAVMKVMVENDMLAGIPRATARRISEDFPTSSIPTFGLHEPYEPAIARFACIDVANGYMEQLFQCVRKVRAADPSRIIIAGNVVTPEGVNAIIHAGADIVKIGIGSGSACSTRLKTGIGYPQLSAIIECGEAAHCSGGYIMSDGGCVSPGDVAKAFGAGADFVMLGGMLAGHRENGSIFQGMASRAHSDRHNGGLKDYRTAEGWELRLPDRGHLIDTLQDILGGLRSTCSYVGAKTIEALPGYTTFVRVNRILNTSLLNYRETI
jgi:GMP reductase